MKRFEGCRKLSLGCRVAGKSIKIYTKRLYPTEKFNFFQRASMLCLSLNADGFLTCSVFFFNFFSAINMILVHINLSKEIYGKFLPKKSCDKDNFHPWPRI